MTFSFHQLQFVIVLLAIPAHLLCVTTVQLWSDPLVVCSSDFLVFLKSEVHLPSFESYHQLYGNQFLSSQELLL